MKELIQNIKSGKIDLIEIPSPNVQDKEILINSSCSLISSGTERMLTKFSEANYLSKALQNPEKVKQVLDKARTDGIISSIEAVNSRLNEPMSLGYSNVGVISKLGENVKGFKIGERVISASKHSEQVISSPNLIAKVPDNVSDNEAAFCVVSSIALQGVRLARPEIGEKFVVIGAGLIGLIAVQILIGNGCKVLAIDYDQDKLKLAKKYGAEIFAYSGENNPRDKVKKFTNGVGADGVLITASSKSNDPINLSSEFCRTRGRIIQVGVTGLNIERDQFFKKELEFRVSSSFGPGRNDVSYEEGLQDYPIGFVRWTMKRNFEAALDLISSKIINVSGLISSEYQFKDAVKAYEELKKNQNSLGILFNYSNNENKEVLSNLELSKNKFYPNKPIVGFIGAGNYASRILIPEFSKNKANLHTVVTSSGRNSVIQGKKFGFKNAATNSEKMLSNPDINTIAIASRHDSHCEFVIKALEQKKNIYVEKPLCISISELERIRDAYKKSQLSSNPPKLCVGFNRRFSPHIKKAKELLTSRVEPISMIMTFNAGYVDPDHWIQDDEKGGKRIIGEACHYIDLMRYFAESKLVSINAISLKNSYSSDWGNDKATISISYEDGSIGTIHYFANGSSLFPKERIEIFGEGKTIQIENFKKMKGFGFKKFTKLNLFAQNKGHENCVKSFLKSIEKGEQSPISIEEIFETTEASIKASLQIQQS